MTTLSWRRHHRLGTRHNNNCRWIKHVYHLSEPNFTTTKYLPGSCVSVHLISSIISFSELRSSIKRCVHQNYFIPPLKIILLCYKYYFQYYIYYQLFFSPDQPQNALNVQLTRVIQSNGALPHKCCHILKMYAEMYYNIILHQH